MTANDFSTMPYETTFATVTYDIKINVFPRKEKKKIQRRESIRSVSLTPLTSRDKIKH